MENKRCVMCDNLVSESYYDDFSELCVNCSIGSLDDFDEPCEDDE